MCTPKTVWNAPVTEQEQHLMCSFRSQSHEVPEHVRILKMSHRVPLLRVDETGKQDGITNEEYGRVVADEVPVSVLGVELDGEATGVTGRVRGPRLSTHR